MILPFDVWFLETPIFFVVIANTLLEVGEQIRKHELEHTLKFTPFYSRAGFGSTGNYHVMSQSF